jgi:tetratricopeptide (TPR) repeat protein
MALYHRLLGQVLRQKGNNEEAEESLRRASDGGDSQALLELAQLYMNAGLISQAEKSLKQAIKARPAYWPYLMDLGLFYYENGRYPEALQTFEEVTGVFPDSIRGWNNLGGIQMYLDRWDQARLSFSRALEVEENFTAYSNLGALDYEESRFADSMNYFLKALEMDDSAYWVWGNLGSAARLSPGQQERASAAFRKAIALAKIELRKNSEDESVLVDLANYYAELGDQENARALIARLQRANTQNPETLVRMGEACVYLKDNDRAREYIEAGLKLGYPRNKLLRIPEVRGLAADPSFAGIFQ